jgi:hypothetical protein
MMTKTRLIAPVLILVMGAVFTACDGAGSDSEPAAESSGQRDGGIAPVVGHGTLTWGDEAYPFDVNRCRFQREADPALGWALIGSAETADGDSLAILVSRDSILGNTMLSHSASVTFTPRGAEGVVYSSGRTHDGDQWCCGPDVEGPLVRIEGSRMEVIPSMFEPFIPVSARGTIDPTLIRGRIEAMCDA